MLKYTVRFFGIVLATATLPKAFATCEVKNSQHQIVSDLRDPLFLTITAEETCPKDVFALKEVLAKDGLAATPSMVANRGRNNPRQGSFSFFEVASGFSNATHLEIKPKHLFFGHFTALKNAVIDLDHRPRRGSLMVELIAWDFNKQLYNFYELIGVSNSASQWFYRGDSQDALADNKNLHLQANPEQPVFGQRMRCSGCHASGGPIMKELAFPHNDWWRHSRPLEFGGHGLSAQAEALVTNTQDASDFAQQIKDGMQLLMGSSQYQEIKRELSFQEQLRPLFCTTEINLESDIEPSNTTVENLNVPIAHFVNPLLIGNAESSVQISRSLYKQTLSTLGFAFPEVIGQLDADHGWLTPVKGHMDLLSIQQLVSDGVVDEEFVADVLAVDFTTPVLSDKRCNLLKLVPKERTMQWLDVLVKNLHNQINSNPSPAAETLLANLTLESNNKAAHTVKATEFLFNIKTSMQQPAAFEKLVKQLQQRRLAVFANEISQNPMGQILEPGFRVIFPQM